MRLVADIGGTNARLALSQDGVVLPETVRSFRNEDFDSFLAVAHRFLETTDAHDLTETVVAVAGPVWGTHAKLTNRDWRFEVGEIASALNLASVALINDLSALGHALLALKPTQLLPILPGEDASASPTQSLIVGIGTGFNVCPVLHSAEKVECMEAEFGHMSLPLSVADIAQPVLGDISDVFPTVEECFSGRGYKAVLERGGTPDVYAELMAALARDLVMAFMPRSGLYFNGGVARSVLTSSSRAGFKESFAQSYALAPKLTVPVSLINDDSAALIGCARVTIEA